MLRQVVQELSRRRVFRGAAIYIFTAWAALRIVDAATPAHDPIRRLALLWAIGLFPFAVMFSWAFQVLPGGIHREHYGAGPPPRTRLGQAIDLFAITGLAVVVAVETILPMQH